MSLFILCIYQLFLLGCVAGTTVPASVNEEEGFKADFFQVIDDNTPYYREVRLKRHKNKGVNTLTQPMFNTYGANTRFIIQYNYNLKGKTIIIPKNCALVFDGGSISNGSVVFDNTYLDGKVYIKNCITTGKLLNSVIYTKWFDTNNFDDFSSLISYENTIVIIEGNYDISKTIILKSNSKILGVDRELAVLRFNNQSDNSIFITEEYYPSSQLLIKEKKCFGNSNIEIANITLDYNRSHVESSIKEEWIKILDCSNVRVNNVKFISGGEYLEYPKAIYIMGSKNVSVANCYCYTVPFLQMFVCTDMMVNNNIGLNQFTTFVELDAGFSGEIRRNTIVNWTSNNNHSVISSNSTGVVIENNLVSLNSEYGFPINLGHYTIEKDLYANDNVVQDNILIGGRNGLHLQTGANIVVKNNYVDGLTAITSSDLNNVLVEANTFCIRYNNSDDYNKRCISITGGDSVVFKNNQIVGKAEISCDIYIEGESIQFISNNVDCKNMGNINLIGEKHIIKENDIKGTKILTSRRGE